MVVVALRLRVAIMIVKRVAMGVRWRMNGPVPGSDVGGAVDG